nr:type II toxin-antitoxin system RelE/ParE family toxin [Sinirhodobacter populi]
MQSALLGDAEPVGEGVSELRVHYGPSYRLYYVRRQQVVIILLCGGDKGSLATLLGRRRFEDGSATQAVRRGTISQHGRRSRQPSGGCVRVR